MPKVSVLMPVYNTNSEHLKDSIESILGQTYKDFEFLILNDCSTDENVEKTILSYSDARIVYIKNEKNLGISLSRNKLLKISKGEYLAVMDHDDISLAQRLEKQVNFLDENPAVGVVGSWSQTIPTNKINKYSMNSDKIKEELLFQCAILHPSSMIRKQVLLDNNLEYENQYSPAEDYALWCRLVSKTGFANIGEVLFKYRVHSSNTSKTQSKKMEDAKFKIWSFVKSDNQELWEAFKYKARNVISVSFLGMPFLRIEKTSGRTERTVIYLFSFIPILVIKNKLKL